MMTKTDKELWLKYAKLIKGIEAGTHFVAPTQLPDAIKEQIINYTYAGAVPELWNDVMTQCKVPKPIRDKARKVNYVIE